MICKNCGRNLEQKERFCPFCGSYFIDAGSEDDGLEWKGIIRADGTVEQKISVSTDRGYTPASSGSRKVWGILAMVFSGIALICNIIGFLTDFAPILLGFPCFVFAIVACVKAGSGKQRGTAMLILFFCVMTFGIGVTNL